MSTNKYTSNNNHTLVAVSNTDGETPVYLYADPTTHGLVLSGTINVSQPSAATVTSVGDTATSTPLIASNTSRKEIEFFNSSSAILYLLKGSGTASASNYTAQLNQGDYYTSNATTAFQGVWASDAGGSVLVTEST